MPTLPAAIDSRECGRVGDSCGITFQIFNLSLENFIIIQLTSFANETRRMSKQTFLDIRAKVRYVRRILFITAARASLAFARIAGPPAL